MTFFNKNCGVLTIIALHYVFREGKSSLVLITLLINTTMMYQMFKVVFRKHERHKTLFQMHNY